MPGSMNHYRRELKTLIMLRSEKSEIDQNIACSEQCINTADGRKYLATGILLRVNTPYQMT